jgi:hypothetical protein
MGLSVLRRVDVFAISCGDHNRFWIEANFPETSGGRILSDRWSTVGFCTYQEALVLGAAWAAECAGKTLVRATDLHVPGHTSPLIHMRRWKREIDESRLVTRAPVLLLDASSVMAVCKDADRFGHLAFNLDLCGSRRASSSAQGFEWMVNLDHQASAREFAIVLGAFPTLQGCLKSQRLDLRFNSHPGGGYRGLRLLDQGFDSELLNDAFLLNVDNEFEQGEYVVWLHRWKTAVAKKWQVEQEISTEASEMARSGYDPETVIEAGLKRLEALPSLSPETLATVTVRPESDLRHWSRAQREQILGDDRDVVTRPLGIIVGSEALFDLSTIVFDDPVSQSCFIEAQKREVDLGHSI